MILSLAIRLADWIKVDLARYQGDSVKMTEGST
jgi:hypothetical protein